MLRIDLLNYFLEVFYVHCMFEYPHLTLFITAISHVTCLTESVSPNNMGMSGTSLVPHCLFFLYWSVIWSWLTWELFSQYKYQQVPTGNLLDDSEGEEVVYHSDSERSHYDPEPEVTLGLQTVLTPQRVWLHLMTLCDLYFSAPVCELFIRFWRREGEK